MISIPNDKLILDLDPDTVSEYGIDSFSYVKAHTVGNQNSGKELANYTKAEYYNLKQNDIIYAVYVKDFGGDANDDTGYLLIPETTAISIEDVDGKYKFEEDHLLDIKVGAELKVGSNFSVDSTGAIKSTSGTIGGFTIDSNRLYAGNPGADNGIELVSIGTNKASIKVGSNFSVDSTGAIKSTSGTIGSLNIADDGLTYGNSSSSSYFKIGSEVTKNPLMPTYSIFAKVQRIDNCIMGFKEANDGSTR